jgi:hypothetical protein
MGGDGMTTVTSAVADEKRAGREFWDANPRGGTWLSDAAFADLVARARRAFSSKGFRAWTSETIN